MTIAVRPQSNGGANLGSAEQRWATTNTQNLDVSANALVGGNLEVTGNLVVNGTSATVNVETLSVEDPLIQVNKSNSSNLTDSGFYDQYVVDGTTKYSGIFRDATDNKFKAFVGLEVAPTTTVNTADASYQTATLVASLQGNASTATALQSSVTLGVSGAVTGSASFDGSTDATISTTIEDSSIANAKLENSSISVTLKNDDGTTIDTSAVSLGQSVSFKEGANVTLTKVGSDIVIATSGQLTGNAATATALATARDFSITGGVISADAISFDGTGNVALSASIVNGSIGNEKLANNSITINGQSTALGGSVTITNIDGNAATATTATTASSWVDPITLTVTDGDVEDGWLVDTTVSFDGSANQTLTLTLNNGGITNANLQTPYVTILGDNETSDSVSLGESLLLVGQDGIAAVVSDNTVTFGLNNTSIDNSKLANSSITVGGVSVALGGTVAINGGDNISVTPSEGAISIGVSGTLSVDTTGNANTASAWASSRTVTFASGDITGNFSIDGSANVDNVQLLIGANTVGNTELDNNAVTNDKILNSTIANDKLANSSITIGGVSVALGGSVGIQGTANEISVTNDGTNVIVSLPDEITVDTVHAALDGNATTATALATSRTISLSGDVTGQVGFDGSVNADIVATIPAASVENSQLANSTIGFTIGGVTDAVALGENLTLVAGSNISISATGENEITIAASGSFSGNATTASALQTARTITLGGDLSGSQTFDGSADITITATLGNGTVGVNQLVDGSVGSTQIALLGVATANIAANAVTSEKLASSVAINTLNVVNTLNLSGTAVTASASELNYVDITTSGVTQASKAWVSDASNDIIHGGNIYLNGAGKTIEIQNGSLDVSGSVTAGNIEVTAAVGSISSTNLKIKDSLVELNFDGSAVGGTRDVGIFGRLDPTNGGNTNVVGLFYDGSDSTWKATYGATPANTNYINSITSYKPIMAQNFIAAGISVLNADTYTTTNEDDTVVVTHNASTVTLHSAGNVTGQKITIVCAAGGAHTTTVSGAVVAITLANNDSVTLVRANSAWYVVSKFVA